MRNEELWAKMDELACKNKPTILLMEFMYLIKQAYDMDLGLITRCFFQDSNKTIAKQAYIDVMGERYLMCYTSEEHARREQGKGGSWATLGARDVLNNMFNKDAIGGIVFNTDDLDNMIICPKPILMAIMPGNHPKPDMFEDVDRKSKKYYH